LQRLLSGASVSPTRRLSRRGGTFRTTKKAPRGSLVWLGIAVVAKCRQAQIESDSMYRAGDRFQMRGISPAMRGTVSFFVAKPPAFGAVSKKLHIDCKICSHFYTSVDVKRHVKENRRLYYSGVEISIRFRVF
jgi:hypothetical protein